MSYEFKRVIPHTDFAKTHKIFYGVSGTGKTTIATKIRDSQDREPYFIFTEEGQGVTQPYGQVITSWPGFIKLRDMLLGPDKKALTEQYSCVVFDVTNELEDMCAKYIAENHRVATVGDLPHGKGWVLLDDTFRDGLIPFLTVMPCVFICHTKDKPETTNGDITNVLQPDLGKRAMNFLNGKADFIMYFQMPSKKSEHRLITMLPDLGKITKSRFPQMNKEFRNVKDKPEATWEAMRTCFNQGGETDGTRSTT